MSLTEETVALLDYLEARGLTEAEAVEVMEFAIRALTEDAQ